MESSSFQSQLLSVMEVLATAAVAEINRRVDDSCAVLRLEVSRSRRDIELLKRKCEVMEAELRRTRMRARRKVFYPPAAERFSRLVKIVLNKEKQSADWSRQDPEQQNPPQQCVSEAAEQILIKEEHSEDDTWKSESEDKLISAAEQPPCFEASQPAPADGFVELHPSAGIPAEPGPLLPPSDVYSALPEQQLIRDQGEAELVVKHERDEEADENAAPLESSGGFVPEEGDGRLWSSGLCRDAVQPGFSYAGQQIEPVVPAFPPQSGRSLEDMGPRIHSEGQSHSVVANSTRMKRRSRALGWKRPQPEEGHNMDAAGRSVTLQNQYRDAAAHGDSTPPNAPASSFSRGSFVLTRKMRTQWRSGIGEKRFSCTYCDKNFTRFSQLKEHLRSHTGEKPFSCLQCGRSFTKQCNLIRHAVVHSGEKPYECSLCGKCFTQRSSLKSHQKTAH